MIPLLGLNITPDKSISENEKTKEKPNRLKRVLQELLSDIEAADSEDYDEDDFNDFDNGALKISGRKYLRTSDSKRKKVRRNSKTSGSRSKKDDTNASKNLQVSVKTDDHKSVKKSKEEVQNKLSNSPVSNEQDFDHQLFFSPTSVPNKFNRQKDSNVNKTNESCGNIPDIDKIKSDLAEYGNDLIDIDLKDKSHKFGKKTERKFDRPQLNYKCTSTQIDDKKEMSEKKEQISKAQQTDGTKNSDLYSTFSDLFKSLCTKHGVEGSIVVENIGRFEIKLSKSLSQNFGNNDDKVNHLNDVPQSQVSLYCNQETQMDCINGENLKEAMVNQYLNTDLLSFSFNCTQTDLDYFVGVDREERLDKINEVKALSQEKNAQNNLEVNIDEEKQLGTNLQSTASSPNILSENEQSVVTRSEKGSNHNLEDVVSNKETQLQLDQVINFDEKKQMSEDGEEVPSSQKLFSQFSLSSKANLSLDFSQVLEFKNNEATQVYSQSETDSKPDTASDGKVEGSSPKRSIEQINKSSFKINENKNDVVMESDEDDDFLMRCVFESLNDDDDDINDIESIHSNSPKMSPVKVKVHSSAQNSKKPGKAKSVEKNKASGRKLRLRI